MTTPDPILDGPWYAVRCVFQHQDDDLASGDRWYEERITLWHAASDDEAMALAEEEAGRYAAENGCADTGLYQGYHLPVAALGPGIEAFSLIRGSRLDPDAYLDAFFDTGTELETDQAPEEPPATS